MVVFGFPSSASTTDLERDLAPQSEAATALRTITLASLALAATALGLYIGRELRIRYKFRRRTPSDFFSKAGNLPSTADYGATEYGMGV